MNQDNKANETYFDDLVDELPGFIDKFNSIGPDTFDEPTARMLDVVMRMGVEKDSFLAALKGAYVLGAYNEFRGLHATKH